MPPPNAEGTSPELHLEVLIGANIPGAGGTRLDYEALVERAGLVQVDNLTILVASLDDVIVPKQVADRPKDHEALPELPQIAERSAPTMGGLVE